MFISDIRKFIEKETSYVLFKHQIIPRSSMGVAPAELLIGRWLRSWLDLHKSDLATTVENSQLKQKLTHDNKQPFKVFTEGESVYVQDFTASKQKWIPDILFREPYTQYPTL